MQTEEDFFSQVFISVIYWLENSQFIRFHINSISVTKKLIALSLPVCDIRHSPSSPWLWKLCLLNVCFLFRVIDVFPAPARNSRVHHLIPSLLNSKHQAQTVSLSDKSNETPLQLWAIMLPALSSETEIVIVLSDNISQQIPSRRLDPLLSWCFNFESPTVKCLTT